MNKLTTTFLLAGMILLPTAQALADGGCSTRSIAGKWMFATGIGRQSLGPPFPEDKDITAIGIFSVDRHGNAAGTFDATVQDFTFIPGIAFTGSVAINPDCTGTLTFVTTAGTARTDSIVLVNKREILGMTQDPLNLWTYQMRKLSGSRDRNHDAED